jgi:acetyl esterase
MAKVLERRIDGPGGSIGLRIYTPAGNGPFPLMMFFHGSGFVLCSLDTHDGMCRNLAAGIRCVVVSVDYRLAPEHKFPKGLDDCLAATRWAAANAVDLGFDPTLIMVAGDSAGGNMAAVTALRIRDEGGPKLCGQMLLYPVTDYHTLGTPSYAENADGYGLTRDTMEWFWEHYLANPVEAENPYASPLRARDLAGLPPAYVTSAEYDPLRDEAERYGERLRASCAGRTQFAAAVRQTTFLFWRCGHGADAVMVGLRRRAGSGDAATQGRQAWAHGGKLSARGHKYRVRFRGARVPEIR